MKMDRLPQLPPATISDEEAGIRFRSFTSVDKFLVDAIILSSGPLRCGPKEVKQLIEHFGIVKKWALKGGDDDKR